MNRKMFFVAALLALTTAATQAWDAGGHLLIDTLAARKLRPGVVHKMELLLPLLDQRFNGGHPYTLATAGLWLDDMRGLGRSNPWARWHYIDVPCAGDRAYSEPPPPHALWALDQAAEVLRSKDAEPRARAEALAQVMHLVADIHQPLHTATRNDRGGNDVPIAPLTADGESGPSNLHAFWDAACRYDAVEGKITVLHITAEQLADKMAVNPAPASPHPWHQWARESHAIACASGWPKEWLAGNQDAPVQLTPAFVHAVHEIALAQVAKAGERLAALLNELLEDEAGSGNALPTKKR